MPSRSAPSSRSSKRAKVAASIDLDSAVSSRSRGSLAHTQEKYLDFQQLGIEVVGDGPGAPKPPFSDTLSDGPPILGVPMTAFSEAFNSCQSLKYPISPQDARNDGFYDIPEHHGGKPLTDRDRQVLYTAVYTQRLFVHIRNNPVDESVLQDLLKDILKQLKFDARVILGSTTTPTNDSLLKRFGVNASARLTAVKPDISVGYEPSAIEYRRNDSNIKEVRLALYLRSHPTVYYNLAMILTLPLFPPLSIEVKAQTANSGGNLQSPTTTRTFLSTNIYSDLGRQAAAADPVCYNAHKTKINMQTTYGLSVSGHIWELTMMSHDEKGEHPATFPIVVIALGSFMLQHDVLRFFKLWEHIMAETNERLDYLGACLYCLRDKNAASTQFQRNNPEDASSDDDQRGNGSGGDRGDGPDRYGGGKHDGDRGGGQAGKPTTRSTAKGSTRQRPSSGDNEQDSAGRRDDGHVERMVRAWRDGLPSSDILGGIPCA